MSGGPAKPAGPGRPRDPGLEDRVRAAAMTLYAEVGWSGFTFDALSRAASVGKAALYRRWASPQELLLDTLRNRWYPVGRIDTGSLREDLVALARVCFDSLTGPHGAVPMHLRADAARHPAVREIARPYVEQLVHEGRQIATRARARGELPAGTAPTLILDLVVGGITNHVVSTPARLRAAVAARADEYIRELVDLVLAGVAHR